MTYRAWIEPDAVRQVHGIPDDIFTELARLLARVCDDPYDAVLSAARPGGPSRRVAELGGGRGFVEFRVDEQAGLVRVSALAWIG